jgi:hypothetical protein
MITQELATIRPLIQILLLLISDKPFEINTTLTNGNH